MRQKRSIDYKVDPFSHVNEPGESRGSRETPSLESVAVGILRNPELLQEIFRRLAWLDKEQLEELRDSIDRALQHREDVLSACTEGRFGRDYVSRSRSETTRDEEVGT
jgi:hypothetical protein